MRLQIKLEQHRLGGTQADYYSDGTIETDDICNGWTIVPNEFANIHRGEYSGVRIQLGNGFMSFLLFSASPCIAL